MKWKTQTVEIVIEKQLYCFSEKCYLFAIVANLSFHFRYSGDQSREPDCDSLKMFVGQIPRDWKEADCRTLLEQFGDIYAINLLRDKKTSKSKGISLLLFNTILYSIWIKCWVESRIYFNVCRSLINISQQKHHQRSDFHSTLKSISTKEESISGGVDSIVFCFNCITLYIYKSYKLVSFWSTSQWMWAFIWWQR